MKNTILKNILYAAGIMLLFIVISYAFVPEVLSGKIVNQSDISGWTGMTNEVVTYNEEHPEDPSFWTNSMFGGMPTISMYGIFKGDWTSWIYDFLLTGARPATYLFISLLGGFLLMLAFGIRPLLAIGGAIAITFCSYNMQIIQVGHNTKMQAIAYMPWVLAAMVYTYRSALAAAGQVLASEKKKKWLMTLLGAVLFAFALSFQIKANHPQISYYLAIVIVVYVLAVFVKILTEKEKKAALAGFFTASALLLVVGGLGICTNLNKLLPTYEYAEYSMRGGSELNQDAESGNEGLELDYATAWSYGIGETPNLLIPDFNGGSSAGNPGLRNSRVRDLLEQARQPDIEQTMDHLPLYWGPQPFTAGPMYIGAISIFLFILGLFLLKGRDKWWLAISTLLAILLAWGSHFMWFTKLWYDLAPLYNKFRTVSMALVILQVTVPLLGFLALDKIWKEEKGNRRIRKAALAAYGITGGVCLLFALFPSLAGTFAGSSDAGMQDVLSEALRADRKSMLVKDAFRSLVFVTLAFGLICWNLRSSGKEQGGKTFIPAGIAMAVLILIDLWGVDKRYLNSSHFTSRRDFSSQFEARPVDKIILEDKSLDYRVLDLSVNTFNDSHTSYWHKSIGGYSPAKMQRYQDLIEHHLTGEINDVIRTVNSSATIQDVEAGLPELPVLSMLNDKYIILGGEYPPVENRQAFGNCWIVSSAAAAATPDEEIAMLSETDLRSTAIIGNDFAWAREKLDSLGRLATHDIAPADSVWMTSYAPNELRYRSRTHSEKAVIFSEIYYPEGWTLTIDGTPADIFRADWILRGAFIPAGEHEIVMRFEPQAYSTGAALSRASSITLYILLILSGAGLFVIRRKMNHRILAAISAVALVVTAPGCCRDNVVTIDMRDYGLSAATPENAAEKIIAAFDYCKSLGRPARIVLEKGTYDIRFDSGSIENPVLLTIDSMKDFTFDGGGSMLYFHGLTGLAGIINSENISLENFSLDWRRPYITQAEVVEMSPDHIDLKIDAAEYPYRIDGDRVKYVCDDGEYDVVEDSYCNYLTPEGKIVPGTSDDYQLYKVLNGPVERLHNGILRFKGKIASSAPAGSRLLIYHVRYKTPWCYCYLTRDITLKDIVIHHCTGCGMISDCCDGILLDNVDYTPSGDRLFTGIADAFHVTHASGLVEMRNCDVDGQGDDAINIHGRYHRMTPAKDDGRTFRCIARSDVPLVYPGDSVWIVNSADMKRSEKYAVEDFTMLGEETFEMVLASPVPETAPDVVLYAENSERNPEVHIHDNRFGSGNRARGVLLTTPRKSVIENNVFESSGAAILIEGDISYWYESGGVTDVRISDNVFYHCATSPWGAAVITLTPSTDIPGYHSGVTISGNRFVMAPGVLPLYTVDSTAVNFLPDNIME